VTKLDEAREWLEVLLRDGPVGADKTFQLAASEGITGRTLRRAADALDVVKTKVGAPGEDGQLWVWSLATFGDGVGHLHGDAFRLLASLTLEDGRAWGEAATSWQLADAAAILADDGPRLHFLTRPRGGSKTTDLAGVVIAVLLCQLPRRGRGYAFAADMDQAGLLLDAIAGFVSRTEGLAGALKIENYRVTAVHNGARLDVMASDAASAWGLKGDLFVVDEYCQWLTTPGPRRLWSAILSAVPKVAGCRLVLLSTAGDPSHPSYKLLGQARESALWNVHEVGGPVAWIDPVALDEQRRLLTESDYARLHENRWTASEDRLVDPEALRECVTLDGWQPPRHGVSYAAALDMAYVNDQAVLAICHREADGGVALDRMHVWQGSRLRPVRENVVEETIREAHRQYGWTRLLLDPWQTKGMGQRLSRAGVHAEEFVFSSQSVGRIALVLYRLLRDRHIALPDDEPLLTELGRVQLRETAPGVYRMDHAHGEHDDRAIALAMCCAHLVDKPTGSLFGSSASIGPIPYRRGDGAGMFNPLTNWGDDGTPEQFRVSR
jgi:phage terminase large subunit-like protein